MLAEMKTLISVAEAAKSLGVNVATVRRWCKLGELKTYTKPGRGRAMFVEKSEVEKRRQFTPFILGSAGFPPVQVPKRKKKTEKR
jgi:excisionase family DNA binding protein